MSIEIKRSIKPVNYTDALKFLEKRVAQIDSNEANELIWILEHPSIFTAGKNYNENEVIDKSINLIKTSRGGKITWHGPGQLIFYFVINLNNRKRDIRKFINIIENSIIEFLRLSKIKARSDKKNIGIWVKNKKIAAIGLRVSKWVAFHGCSINIKNNLKDYLKIIPCGLDNKNVTSIKSEKKNLPRGFEKKLIKIFIKNINKI